MLIKKLFLITALFIWGFSQQAPLLAQKDTPEQVQYFAKEGKVFKVTNGDTTEVQGGEVVSGVQDTTIKQQICFPTEDGGRVCIDAKATYEDVVAMVGIGKEAKKAWETGGLMALILFLLGVAGKITQHLTSIVRAGREAGKVLKGLPKKPHRIVAFVALGIGAVAGFVWNYVQLNTFGFDIMAFVLAVPSIYGVAVFVFEEWIKKTPVKV